MNPGDDKFKLMMLSNELAALLHDIGKYSVRYVKVGTGKGDVSHAHTVGYFEDESPLKEVLLNTPLPQGWLQIPDDGRMNWAYLGDIAYYHHYNIKEYKHKFGDSFQEYQNKLPSTLFLIMAADTTDSAASKGGMGFEDSVLVKDRFKQSVNTCYLADPLGNCERPLDLEKLQKQVESFQQELAELLRQTIECEDNIKALISKREEIICFLKRHFKHTLAETRLPNNDVSLWQHTYSTSALFKAMLAGNALKDEWNVCDEKGNPVFYTQSLAVMGITWEQDKLLSISHRSAEILGLRLRLDNAVQELKDFFETGLCLGNEIYRDADGIYFLVPDLDLDNSDQPVVFRDILTRIEDSVNRIMQKQFQGVLEWSVQYHPIGLNILELAKVKEGKPDSTQVIFTGPRQPEWTLAWQAKTNMEACPRCTLFPKSLEAVKSGSEGDKSCDFCEKVADEGRRYRYQTVKTQNFQEQGRRLLGIDPSAQYCTFNMEDLSGSASEDQEGAGNRVALIQGVFDLSRVFNGEFFSYIMGAQPEDYCLKKESKNPGEEIDTWEKMLDVAERNWKMLRNIENESGKTNLTSLKQIFQDDRLGSKKDGRVKQASEEQKALTVLEQHLQSPFPAFLEEDVSKLVNYALRQHPAPSRLARVWESTLAFNRQTIEYCEHNTINYTPLNLDSHRFMLLVPAARAWEVLNEMYRGYAEKFARVRHLIPMHLSTVIFYHKSPLYIAIDAARRFQKSGMRMSAVAKRFLLQDIQHGDKATSLNLKSDKEDKIVWNVPRELSNNKQDYFYSWYRILGESRRPVHLSELEPGMEIEAYPSSFDYEVLDATVRRYDIFPLNTGAGRPHLIAGINGPRPYLLERLPVWQYCWGPLSRMEEHQGHMLMGKLAGLHQEWHDYRSKSVFKKMVKDFLLLALKENDQQTLNELIKMGCRGELSDIFEWKNLIAK